MRGLRRFWQDFLDCLCPRRTKAQRRGWRGERLAERWLRRQRGYRLVRRNWRAGRGEIDLIMRDEAAGALVFVEVRSRAAHALVGGYHSIRSRKRRVLRRTIGYYLKHLRSPAVSWRFDVVEVAWKRRGRAEVRHFESVQL